MTTNILEALNDDLSTAVSGVRRSLVQIHNGPGAGAGTIWQADGLIITNAHVVSGRSRRQGWGGRRRSHRPGGAEPDGPSINVTLPDGRTVPANILARDKSRDLAALSVQAENLPTIELGDSRALQPGQWVMAVGHPWGVLGAASAGVVIDVGQPPELPRFNSELIQVDLQLRPGHSGGPLVDTQGRLVGINTMISGPEVGLAIPVHAVKTFLRQALASPDLTFV